MGDDHGKLAGNPGEEYIRFCSDMVAGLPPGDTHVDLEMVNASFHDGSDFIKGNPFTRLSLDTRKHTETHVSVCIGGAPLFSGAAGIRTITQSTFILGGNIYGIFDILNRFCDLYNSWN